MTQANMGTAPWGCNGRNENAAGPRARGPAAVRAGSSGSAREVGVPAQDTSSKSPAAP